MSEQTNEWVSVWKNVQVKSKTREWTYETSSTCFYKNKKDYNKITQIHKVAQI